MTSEDKSKLFKSVAEVRMALERRPQNSCSGQMESISALVSPIRMERNSEVKTLSYDRIPLNHKLSIEIEPLRDLKVSSNGCIWALAVDGERVVSIDTNASFIYPQKVDFMSPSIRAYDLIAGDKSRFNRPDLVSFFCSDGTVRTFGYQSGAADFGHVSKFDFDCSAIRTDVNQFHCISRYPYLDGTKSHLRFIITTNDNIMWSNFGWFNRQSLRSLDGVAADSSVVVGPIDSDDKCTAFFIAHDELRAFPTWGRLAHSRVLCNLANKFDHGDSMTRQGGFQLYRAVDTLVVTLGNQLGFLNWHNGEFCGHLKFPDVVRSYYDLSQRTLGAGIKGVVICENKLAYLVGNRGIIGRLSFDLGNQDVTQFAVSEAIKFRDQNILPTLIAQTDDGRLHLLSIEGS
jgi:hypothetical protein